MNLSRQHSHIAFYAAAMERTLRQFIEAFWFEGALNGHVKHGTDGVTKLHLLGLDEQQAKVEYQINAQLPDAFGRTRLFGPLFGPLSGPLRDSRNEKVVHDIVVVTNNLLRHLQVDEDKIRRFITELTHTAVKQAYSLTTSYTSPLELPYAWQEAQLGDGHLYHPCYRSRMGFSLEDHQRYGPEFAQPFGLIWLAIAKDLCDIHALDDCNYSGFIQAESDTQELLCLQQAITDQGRDNTNYYLLPAHPWHWQHSLQIQYADWLADGSLLYLGVGSAMWLAQQSIRSLSSLASTATKPRLNIKLPLAIANSSADRILSDHHVHNAALISQWLLQLCAQDSYLQHKARLSILAEPMGITLKPAFSRKDRYGLLGAIWRQSPESILRDGEQVFPCTALNKLDSQQQLEIAPWLATHGTEAWVSALLQSMLPPFLHLMVAHGVLLEAHAQNTLLIVNNGLPTGVAIRDLPGGLHYVAGHTTNETQISALRHAPAHRNLANASAGFAVHAISEARDYLLEVLLFIHLSELAHRLERHHGFSEKNFWQLASQTVLNYQMQVPELAERFALYDLFVPTIQIERLATRRLSASSQQEFHSVPNPLHDFLKHPGA
ncbi:IucA/IucC family protein [Undibacterium sp. Di26W]|uniref:IucA/IucC family protein n=1 Tax=Undibacterium sp. Di26W TaxID=3413035 RepID=UPI003BF0E52E